MKHIVVLTGAGMSAESGIATFRDTGGLWEQHRIEDVATPEGFHKNPQLVLDFYNARRKAAFDAKPNGGHIGLAEMEADYKVSVITQNVDDLHERAGSTRVLHLHGELSKVRSTVDPSLIYTLTPDNAEIHIGDKCEKGSQLRPHIVWFGEAVPAIEEAVRIVQKADVLVVIGTSLNVYPAAGLLNYAPPATPIYLIDPNEVKTTLYGVHFIRKGASEGVAELRARLNKDI
ncbi:NAD-dependent deacetylase [Dysgonomonas sp. PFB1-18]|uniref:SIR2 family NAD-dependent protein deacylase n=1 Tax=unclassified Dysgonomonas TaxID=2630389 RepID=UPI00247447C6|nr:MULTISPECIES: NAD-dependent deacylase [unclassified Dysgonomonas]MDH6308450.1 NAD-dependent deacetylase [Dysgonomonas sp. PF1-14]MDH6337951.1 NAD-dependent deacetylase [Dysgonomonas sp. PF1-16]MDH6379448.1 NAD-dependent deacetylase [Dysgonomonas sp. PFB1-18]MDH6396779.1 NAD-dependent deacetylase [Dysgonomonas sp. PF1-23]